MRRNCRGRAKLDDDGSPHDLAVIQHLLALRIMKPDERSPAELSELNSPNDWINKGTYLASSSGIEGQVCGISHCLITLSVQNC